MKRFFSSNVYIVIEHVTIVIVILRNFSRSGKFLWKRDIGVSYYVAGIIYMLEFKSEAPKKNSCTI